MHISKFEGLFTTMIAAFAFFLPMVLALVQLLKSQLGLEGEVVKLLGFAVGVLVATPFALVYFFPQWGEYVVAGFFVLAIGLVASGVYDLGKRFVE